MDLEGHQRRAKCQKEATSCQSKFDVPAMSSHEWLQQQQQQQETGSWIVVDVRTAPERKVSMIRGAKTLTEFDRDWRAGNIPNDTNIAFYCTIGYRSGIHATKYLRQNKDDLDGRVFNLDGIVAFSQAVADKIMHDKNTDNARDWLIEPSSGEPATFVHTFGFVWNYVDPEVFSSISYSLPILLLRLLQVGATTSGHHIREGFYFLKGISARKKPTHKQS